MMLLMIAGICILLGGIAAIGFGIPVHEFSFGNTLILAGTVASAAGAILIGLSVVVREIKEEFRRLALPNSDAAATPQTEPRIDIGMDKSDNDEFSLGDRTVPNVSDIDQTALPPPPEPDMGEPVEAEVSDTGPPAKPRRNLLFASSSRKERERAAAKNPDSIEAEPPAAAPVAPPAPKPIAPKPSFDDAWPPSERGRAEEAPPRTRMPPRFNPPSNGAPGPDRYVPPRPAEQPPVTVLKSGIVDGMAYSLYSDGSIEAQMPEGMMRFASIDELRSHLDQRP